MTIKIISEKEIPLIEVKSALEHAEKRDTELSFRAKKTLEYLHECELLTPADSKTLRDAITALNIPRLREAQISKIVDLLPKTEQEVKVILQGYTISLTKEQLGKIVKCVADVVPKKK